jgi:methanogenic corrinoid protein MtbC1
MKMSLTEARRQELQAQLKAAIDEADEQAGVALAQAALAEGITPVVLFRDVIQPVLQEIGDAFARLDVFLPDLMRAGLVVKAMQQEVLEPAIRQSGGESGSAGTVVIGTAQGDIHDIGKNMVALMLQVNGFKVVDLGTNVSPQTFIDAARRERADIIAMSSLLTPTLPYIKDLVKRLESLDERKRYTVIAGGAPITRDWAQAAGLDGFGEDAVEAVAVCQSLMEQRKESRQ